MAETNWATITLKPPFTEEVNTILDKGEQVLSKLVDILQVIKDILTIAKLIASLIAGNLIEALIAQLLKEIDQLLEGLLHGTRLHAIIIPIQKQSFGIGIEINLDALLKTDENVIHSSAQLSEDGKINNSTTAYSQTNVRDFLNFIDTSAYAVGGNRGFYRTLAESVQDEGDPNRPLFTDNFAVVGSCLLVGSRSVDTLYRLAVLLNALLRLGDRTDPLRHAFPTIQNLKARVIPITNAGSVDGRIGIALSWDPIPPRINFPFYNNEEATIDEIIIVRSTDPVFRQKFTWSEVFNTNLVNDINVLPTSSSGRTKVIKRIKFDGFTVGYVDDDPTLVGGAVYYYTTILRYELNDKFLPLKTFSNTVRVQFVRSLVSANSEPPDWIATPSLAELFPILEEIVGLIRLLLAELTTKSLTGPTLLDQLIEMIEFLIKKGETAVAILREIMDVIRALFNNDIGGLYATVFTVDYGGINAWNAELARRLSLRNDPSRPPFDDPEDLTTGVVIVGGVPVIGSINVSASMNTQKKALETLFNLLFGGGSSKPILPGHVPPPNPVLVAIATLETAIAEAEQIAFSTNLSTEKTSITAPVEKPKTLFDQNMLPTKAIC